MFLKYTKKVFKSNIKIVNIPKRLIIMSAFIQRLNPLTGTNEWIVENEQYDYHQEVARAAFADMLHDTERNVMYEKALQIAIETMHEKGLKANVLDIGTGTGLLSMMAVKHNADSVIACEAFGPMSKCANEVIKLNNYSDKIKIIPKRSTDLIIGQDMPCKVNILVTEVFDTELIGEGALGTFHHAHEHLLEKDCIVVPHSGTIYAQIVESPLLINWNRHKDLYNAEGELELKTPSIVKNCKGSINLHDLQLSELPLEFVKTLVGPQEVFKFDFSGKTPIIFQRSQISNFKSDRDGLAQAVFMWWDLKMDIKNEIVLSCAPYWAHPLEKFAKDKKKIPWRDHWMQAIYYFPKEVPVTKGEELNLACSHDEYSLWFSLKRDLQFKDEDFECPVCTCNLHNAYSRTRLGQLNDGRRNKKYLKLIRKYVKKDHVVLVLSHGFFSALVSAKVAKKVYFLDNNQLSKCVVNDFIKANDINNVEIIDTDSKIIDKIDIVLSEPYFVTSLLPWDNLLFLHLLKKFEYCLKENVLLFPQRVLIKAVAMEFDNLHKIRAPLESCQGFHMKPFDQLIEDSSGISDEVVEAQPLWEYPGRAVSEVQEIADIKMEIPSGNIQLDSKITFEILKEMKCNGIAVWVDWIFDETDERSTRISSGPLSQIQTGKYVKWDMYTRQGVALLGNISVPKTFSYNFTYDFQNAFIKFKPCF